MSFRRSIRAAAQDAGGSTQTRHARDSTARDYADWAAEKNIQTRDAAHIRSKDVRDYLADRQAEGMSIGTLQNRAAHLRAITEAAGCRYELPSNAELGVSGRSRDGTRTAMTDANYQAARAALIERGSHAEAAALALQRTLGLRTAEALQSPRTLALWERQLEAGERVHVIHGTKGGRDRFSEPADRAAALAAVREARSLVQGNRLVVTPKPTFVAARSRYLRELSEVGLKGQQSPHTARYAYAQDRLASYAAKGYDTPQARSATSQDLGHGDGRGTYVAQVYSR